MRILYLTGRLPWPLHKGDQLRAYHQLRYLARNHEVTLVSLVSDPEELAAGRDPIERLGIRLLTVRLPSWQQMMNAVARAAVQGLPLQVGMTASRRMAELVRSELSTGYDVLYIQLSRLGEYAALASGVPIAVDLVDCLALNMKHRADTDETWQGWLARFDARRLLRYERRLVSQSRVAFLVSARDKEWLDPEDCLGIEVLPNGVDARRFQPLGPREARPTVVFHGNMGYFPNDTGVQWFIKEVWPWVTQVVPDARFKVVGTSPSPQLIAMAEQSRGVEVTGAVDDVTLHVASAHVSVCPLFAGSGLQNKVLEAMACETPVVVTPVVRSAFEVDCQELMVEARSAADMAREICHLLQNPERRHRLGSEGRRAVLKHYDWDALGAKLESRLASLW